MHSKGKYTPFEGLELNARVMRTFLRGNLIVDKGLNLQTDERTGQFVARG
jgi:dihydroorotase-like cyclic amidohydrolase